MHSEKYRTHISHTLWSDILSLCPYPVTHLFSPPFRRKARGHSIRLSVVLWFRGSIPPPPSNSRYLVCATPPRVLCRSFWNFTSVFVMVWKCACGLDIIFRLTFVTFPHFELSHNWGANSIKVYIYWVPCVRNSFNNFMSIFLKLYMCFCHGLKMCMWFGCNPQINFVTFSAFWTYLFFSLEYC